MSGMFDSFQPAMASRHAPALADMVRQTWLFSAMGKGLKRVSEETTPDWSALLRRVAEAQDNDAFAALFAHFGPRVKAYLMKSGADAASAEECAQDVMVTVWRKAGQFDQGRASAATWIFTIARNRRIDMLRRDKRPDPENLPWGPEAEPDQEDALALQQESAQLTKALRALPEAQRSMIERAYFADLSHSEIADVTGLPLGTIKSRIRLALERLRHSLN